MAEVSEECEPIWIPMSQLQANEVKFLPRQKPVTDVCKVSKERFFDKECLPSIDIIWKNVGYEVKSIFKRGKKAILKDVSGIAHAGELTAIMGPSGSGKSTLLNILSGFVSRNVSGKVFMKGIGDCQKTNISSYVMQENLVLPFLTVKELITIAANIKLPEKVSKNKKKQIVGELISNLGLTDCINTRSDFLSGGERKRLCIAQELVNKPPVIFLDEPTCGLDSLNSLECIKLLKSFANQGHTMICVIHQPSASILNYFDKLYILSEGECIYSGTIPNMISILSSHGFHCPNYQDPADFIIEVASTSVEKSVEDLKVAMKYQTTNETLEYENTSNWNINVSSKNKETIYSSGPWTQFKVIMSRSYKSMWRDTILTRFRLIMYIASGIVIGLLYFKIGNEANDVLNNIGFIFLSIIFIFLSSLMPSAISFPLEFHVYVRERQNNWHRSYIYYLARSTVDLPVQILFTCVFCSIIYWMTDQPNDIHRFLLFCFNACTMSIIAQSIGIICGILVGIEISAFVAPICSLPCFMFSSFFLKMSRLPLYIRWISYLSFFRYNFEIVMHSIYGYDRPDLHCSKDMCPFASPKNITIAMDVDKAVIQDDVIVIVVFCIMLRLMGYIFLQLKVYSKR